MTPIFDGAAFTTQGIRCYLLSCTCGACPRALAFIIQVANEYLSPTASMTRAQCIEVDVHGVKVMMETQTPKLVQVSLGRVETRNPRETGPHPRGDMGERLPHSKSSGEVRAHLGVPDTDIAPSVLPG